MADTSYRLDDIKDRKERIKARLIDIEWRIYETRSDINDAHVADEIPDDDFTKLWDDIQELIWRNEYIKQHITRIA